MLVLSQKTENIKDKSEQSHYYIKFDDIPHIDDLLIKFKDLKFDDNNTVGPKSISKQELIPILNDSLS